MYFLILIFVRLILINIIEDAVAMHDGKNVEEGNFKFMVHIDSPMGNKYQSCGGVVIDEFHVITAAHCVAYSKLSTISVFIGSVSIPPSSSLSYRQPVKIYVHPNHTSAQHKSIRALYLDFRTSFYPFNASESLRTGANDIAVVEVHRSIPLGDTITNANLPDSDVLPYCDGLHVASWHITEGCSWSVTLQSTEVELIDDNDCYVPILSEHFCANTADLVERFGPKYVSEGSTVRDCVENCVEKEVWSTRTYCCQNDGCNKAGPSLHAAITTLWMTSIALGIVAAGRLGG